MSRNGVFPNKFWKNAQKRFFKPTLYGKFRKISFFEKSTLHHPQIFSDRLRGWKPPNPRPCMMADPPALHNVIYYIFHEKTGNIIGIRKQSIFLDSD